MLIEQNDVCGLSKVIFNQHYDHSSKQGYTCPLGAKNEVLAVKQMLQTQSADWFKFLSRYQQHYPLSALAEDELADNAAENVQARELLLAGMKQYGCTPALATHLCRFFMTAQTDGSELIAAVCTNSRIRSLEVRALLERLADREHTACPDKNPPQYLELYDKSINDYRNRV